MKNITKEDAFEMLGYAKDMTGFQIECLHKEDVGFDDMMSPVMEIASQLGKTGHTAEYILRFSPSGRLKQFNSTEELYGFALGMCTLQAELDGSEPFIASTPDNQLVSNS